MNEAPSAETQLRYPADANFFTLAGHTVETVASSYSPQTESVIAMEDSIRDESERWPGFWYEILQGAWTFNDWSKGPPRVLVYFEGEAKPVDIWTFITRTKRVNRSKFLSKYLNKTVAKVEVRNWIRNGSGLEPHNLLITRNDPKDRANRLGQHGEGLKNSMTLATCTELAGGFTASSWTPQTGAWYGEARVMPFQNRKGNPEHVHLQFHESINHTVPETIITVHKPAAELIESLVRIEEWFLFLNRRYRFQNLHADTYGERNKKSNIFTVFATHSELDSNEVSLDAWELATMGQDHLFREDHFQPPRVEILSPEHLRLQVRDDFDFVYVDGLRVSTPGQRWSNLMHFVGWGHGNLYGYNPKRSSDSRELDGGWNELVAIALVHCTDYRVFHNILSHDISTMHEMVEANLPRHILSRIEERPATAAALKKAFLLLSDGNKLMTNSHQNKLRAERDNLSATLITSKSWYNVIREIIPKQEVQTVEEYYEEFDTKHKQELHSALALVKKLEDEKKQNFFSERGLKPRGDGWETGDIFSFDMVSDPKAQMYLEEALSQLLYLLALRRGRISRSRTSIRIKMDLLEESIPQRATQMGEMLSVIIPLLQALNHSHGVYIRYILNGSGAQFEANPSFNVISRAITAEFSRQLIQTDSERGTYVEIELLPKLPDEPAIHPLFEKFSQMLATAESELVVDGVVNAAQYRKSEFLKKFPIKAAVLEAELQLAEQRRLVQAQYTELRKQLMAYGLPDPNEVGAVIPQPVPKHRLSKDGFRLRNVIGCINPSNFVGLSVEARDSDLRSNIAELSFLQRVSRMFEHAMVERTKRMLSPDITVWTKRVTTQSRYLTYHPNPESSGRTHVDYLPLPPLQYYSGRHERPELTIRYHKSLEEGLHSIKIPIGYKPIGWWHPNGKLDVRFSGNPSRNVYAMYFPREVEKGLEIYYCRDTTIDVSTPTARELQPKAVFHNLEQVWKDLLEALSKDSSLNNEQKVGILMHAWVRRFHYSDTNSAYSAYGDLPHKLRDFELSPSERTQVRSNLATSIINLGVGNCGYASLGFEGLVSLLGIPVRNVDGVLLSPEGTANLIDDSHGYIQVYLNNRWVFIEPQRIGFIDGNLQFPSVPRTYKTLLARLPIGKVSGPQIQAQVHGEPISEWRARYLSLRSELILYVITTSRFLLLSPSMSHRLRYLLGEFDELNQTQKLGLTSLMGIPIFGSLAALVGAGMLFKHRGTMPIDVESVSDLQKTLSELAQQYQSAEILLQLLKTDPKLVLELIALALAPITFTGVSAYLLGKNQR